MMNEFVKLNRLISVMERNQKQAETSTGWRHLLAIGRFATATARFEMLAARTLREVRRRAKARRR